MEYSAKHEPPAVAALAPTGERATPRRFWAPFAERRLLLVAVDALVLAGAAQGAFALWRLADPERFGGARPTMIWFWSAMAPAVWLTLSWLNDLYDIPSSAGRARTVRRVAIVAAMFFLLYLLVFFIAPREALPRLFFVALLALAAGGVGAWRLAYGTWGASRAAHRVLIVGDGVMGRTIARVLRESEHARYEVLGFIGGAPAPLEREVGGPARPQPVGAPVVGGLPLLGTAEDLGYLVHRLRAQEVVVVMDEHLDRETFQALIECQAWGVKVSYMPDLYEKLRHRIPVEHIDPAWALHVIQDRPVFDRVQLALKRALDLALAGTGLLVLLPAFPLIALAIRLDSPGPIFYRQVRCGQGGAPFRILKFRTMTANAEGDGRARWASRGDSRVTRVGRLLRRTRLDELPQLINVLRGEMSVVGPRPERPEFVARLQREVPFYYTRLMVKPGITGWAQIHYDYGNSVEDALIKLQYDFYYLRYWSVWIDLYTIFQTARVVLQLKGI